MTRLGEISSLSGGEADKQSGRPEKEQNRQPVHPTENRGGSQACNSAGDCDESGKHATPAQTITVRRATLGDLTAIEAIERGCFAADGDAFSRRQLSYLIHKAQGGCYVACSRQRIVGYISLLTHRTTRNVRIYSVAVDASARGTGVGHALIAAAIDFAHSKGLQAVTLEVRTDNTAALALYAKAGFKAGKRLHNYYHDGADGRRMEYHIG